MSVADEADARVLYASGELDIASSAVFLESLRRACVPPVRKLVIDASRLEFLDGDDLRALWALHGRLLKEGQEGVVLRGCSGLVLRIVEVLGFTSMLEGALSSDLPGTASAGGAVLGFSDLDRARQVADLSVPELFVAYIALGGTADLARLRAFLAGRAGALDRHQRDVMAHAINERLVDLGYIAGLLASGAHQRKTGEGSA